MANRKLDMGLAWTQATGLIGGPSLATRLSPPRPAQIRRRRCGR